MERRALLKTVRICLIIFWRSNMTKTTIKWLLQIHLEIVFCCILKYFNFYAELEYDDNGTINVSSFTYPCVDEWVQTVLLGFISF